MKNLVILVGFLPWIVFSLISDRLAANAVAWSALIAVAMTAVSIGLSLRTHGPKILNLGSLVLFAAIAIVGFIGGPSVDDWLFTWGVPLVGVVLGLYVLATVPFLPFTEEYARQSVPKEYWGSPDFRRINRVLSTAWGVAILLMGVLSVLVTVLGARTNQGTDNQYLDLLLNWILPIAIIWFMVKFTVSYPDRARNRSGQPADQQPAA